MNFFDIVIRLFKSRENDPSWYTKDRHPDMDRHRIHAHSQHDAMLEMDKISPQECQQRKANWDKRHGY